MNSTPMPRAALDRLDALDPDSGLVNVVIDTPKGSRCKYKYDGQRGVFRLSKLLPAGAVFPYDFGFVPSTRGEDGDPLDVLVLLDEIVPVGCVVPVLLIGVLEARQTEKEETVRNDRLIGVVETPYNVPEHRSLGALNPRCLDEIEHFFVSYNEQEGRQVQMIGRRGPAVARKLLAAGRRSF